jgi:hypothetical protein
VGRHLVGVTTGNVWVRVQFHGLVPADRIPPGPRLRELASDLAALLGFVCVDTLTVDDAPDGDRPGWLRDEIGRISVRAEALIADYAAGLLSRSMLDAGLTAARRRTGELQKALRTLETGGPPRT